MQRALELLYRVRTAVDVGDFMISGAERDGYGVARAPHEQLLLRAPSHDELEIALFVDEDVLHRLSGPLDEEHIPEYLLAVEGVSHFVYAIVHARAGQTFSALELELQAEVDKYLLVLLGTWREGGNPRKDLRERLFYRIRYADDLSDEERERYVTANAAAAEYVASLEERFVRHRAVDDMLAEMRRFYRLDCAAKLDHIARKAA